MPPVMFRIVEDDMPPIPEICSPLMLDFLTQCFSKDPAKRPTAENLFEHAWLKQAWGEHKVSHELSVHIRERHPADPVPPSSAIRQLGTAPSR